MKRAWVVVVCAVFAVLMAASSAAADAFNPHSPEELRDHGWVEDTADLRTWFGRKTGEQATVYCKTATQVTEDDKASLPIEDSAVQAKVDEFIQHYKKIFAGSDHEQEKDSDYAMFCVSPEHAEDLFFCVSRNRSLPEQTSLIRTSKDKLSSCWGEDGEKNESPLEELVNTALDPVGTVVDNTIDSFANQLAQGVRWLVSALLYWWIVQHPELEESSAGVLWPVMLGLGLFVGTLLLMGQGIRLMFSRQPDVLVSTVKGLGVFTVVSVSGVAIIASLGHGADWLSMYFLAEGSNYNGCSAYQAQPDGLALDFPDAGNADADTVELGKAFASCAAASLFTSVPFSALIIVLYIVAFIMSFVQGALLFVREAALPIMALLLPIAAAGQIGSTTTKRWLPSLLSLIATVLLYKPMIALIFAVGFAQASLSNDVADIMRGLITMLVGVIAPGVMMKAFKPLMTTAVEEGASVGSVLNNVFLASQVGGSINQWMERRAGARAARAAQQAQAARAAYQGAGTVALSATKNAATTAAGTAAGAAAGPLGWALTAMKAVGQFVKSAVSRNAVGTTAQTAARAGGAAVSRSTPAAASAAGASQAASTPGGGAPAPAGTAGAPHGGPPPSFDPPPTPPTSSPATPPATPSPLPKEGASGAAGSTPPVSGSAPPPIPPPPSTTEEPR